METLLTDIYEHMINFLTPVQICKLIQCSKTMKIKLDTDRIWRAMVRKQFGDVTRDDVIHANPTWKNVCRVYWVSFGELYDVMIDDCEKRKWPFLYRRSDRCMLIPLHAKGIKARRGDIYMLKSKTLLAFEPKCIVLQPRSVKIETGAYGPYTLVKQEATINFQKRYKTSFAIPTEFCYPEFPPNYFYHVTKKIVNIKLSAEMIDEMIIKKTLTLPGQKPIKIPSYECPSALLPNILVFTWCPKLDAFDEA